MYMFASVGANFISRVNIVLLTMFGKLFNSASSCKHILSVTVRRELNVFLVRAMVSKRCTLSVLYYSEIW